MTKKWGQNGDNLRHGDGMKKGLWKKSTFKGVRYREHETRKHGVAPDRYFSIRYQVDGKRVEEGLGWSSEGWTAEDAFYERKIIMSAHKKGEGLTTLKEKREIADQKRKEQEAEKERLEIFNTSLKDFFDDTYYPIAKTSKKESSYKKEKQLFETWIKPVMGDKPFYEITPFLLEKLKKEMLDAGKSPRTIEYVFSTLRVVWNAAKRHGLTATDSPTKEVKLPRVDNERQRYLTQDETDRLFSAIKDKSKQLYRMSLLSLHCGLRAGEIFNLQWSDIDTGRGIVRLGETKAGKTQFAYMTDQIKQMFEEMKPGAANELVFQARGGGKIKAVSNAFDRAVDDCGLNNGITDPKQRIVFHSLRHCYGSHLVGNGVALYTVQKLMRHSNIKTTARYSHLNENTLQNAVKQLGTALSPNAKKTKTRKKKRA